MGIILQHPLHTQHSSSSNIFPVPNHFTHNLIMTFSHGVRFLSLLEQPKDSMGGGYQSKYEPSSINDEAPINPTEPITNGHKDDSSIPAPAELTNGHQAEEPTAATEAVAHGSEADILSGSKESSTTVEESTATTEAVPQAAEAKNVPESKESSVTIAGINVAAIEEPATHVPVKMVAPILGSTKLQRLLKGSNDLIVCPGVYDGFSARIAMSVGFPCLYMV